MGSLWSCWCPSSAEPRTAPIRPSAQGTQGTLTAKASANVYVAVGADGYEFVENSGTVEGREYKLMRNKRINELVMVKFVNTSVNNGFPKEIEREIINHRSLNHPNISRFYEVLILLDGLGIVSEYPNGGALSERLKRYGPVTEGQAKQLFVQLLAGMQYCHDKKICHRDLRVENMFLDDQSGATRLKISGFGYSKSTLWDGDPKTLRLNEQSDHLNTPPELLEGTSSGGAFDGTKLDMWGAGLSLYFMLTCERPFEDPSHPGVMNKVTANKIKTCSFSFPSNILLSPECKDFIVQIFKANPQERPSIADVLELTWLAGAVVPQPAGKSKAITQQEEDINDIVQRARQRSLQEAQARAQARSQRRNRGRGAHTRHPSQGPNSHNSQAPSSQGSQRSR